jgi:hypothetical protein
VFTDRDLVINGGLSDPWVGISPLITSQWTGTGGGTWSDDTKWSLAIPDGRRRAGQLPCPRLPALPRITVDAAALPSAA